MTADYKHKPKKWALGPMLTSVDTSGLDGPSGGWGTGNGFSHYVSVTAYQSGPNGGIKFFDTSPGPDGTAHGPHTYKDPITNQPDSAQQFYENQVLGQFDHSNNKGRIQTDGGILF